MSRGVRDDDLSMNQLAASAFVVAAMSAIATIGFQTVFASSTFLIPSVVGATLGALVVLLGHQFRLLFGETLGLGLIAPLLIGPLAAGGTGFYQGLVYGWSDILSATPPLDPTPDLKALPFVAAFAGGLAGTQLARFRELPGLAIIGPIATLSITALFTEQTRNGAVAVGLVLLIGLLLIARLQHGPLSTMGLLVLTFVLGLLAALTSTLSLLLPYADEANRIDLRELQVPPWDPLAVASPLTEVKAGLVEEGSSEQPVLRVTGDVPVDRWRLAALPAFNGVYWSVAEADSTTDFVAIDTFLPEVEGESDGTGLVAFNVEVLAPIGHWVPVPGVPSQLRFADQTDVRMSLETGTLGTPDRLPAGTSYEVAVQPWSALTDAELATLRFASDQRAAELDRLPPSVRNLAADFATGIDQLSGQRVLAIRNNLLLGSYDIEEVPGHSYGRVAELIQLVQVGGSESGIGEPQLRTMAAYEELYAATAGVLTRLSNIPVRVGVGYVLPQDRWVGRTAEVFASDANAWIEVHVDGQGWMPIDVTPDRSRVPEEANDQVEQQGVPVADPPKEPPPPEDQEQPEIEEIIEEPEEEEEQEDDEEDTDQAAIVRVVAVAAAALSATFVALLLIGLAIVGFKWWRRRRRRLHEVPSARIAGAWAELVDRVDEAGGDLPARATPAEAARYAQSIEVLSKPEVAAHVERLADQVSVGAFHPVPPTPETAAEAWDTYDEIVASLADDAGPGTRIRRALDPRTLRDDGLVGAPMTEPTNDWDDETTVAATSDLAAELREAARVLRAGQETARETSLIEEAIADLREDHEPRLADEDVTVAIDRVQEPEVSSVELAPDGAASDLVSELPPAFEDDDPTVAAARSTAAELRDHLDHLEQRAAGDGAIDDSESREATSAADLVVEFDADVDETVSLGASAKARDVIAAAVSAESSRSDREKAGDSSAEVSLIGAANPPAASTTYWDNETLVAEPAATAPRRRSRGPWGWLFAVVLLITALSIVVAILVARGMA